MAEGVVSLEPRQTLERLRWLARLDCSSRGADFTAHDQASDPSAFAVERMSRDGLHEFFVDSRA
jgi:hypothetical protein